MTRPPVEGAVLVTGASSGIGEALARRLATVARRLVLVARRVDRLEALAAELRRRHPTLDVVVLPADLADPDSVDALVAAAGHVDVLVNNAGLGDLTLFERSAQAKNDALIAANVSGLVRLTRALLPGMILRRRGGILNVSSVYGLTWTPGAAVYIGTKHFVHGFTQSLRSEVRGVGIVVTELSPGPVATEFEDVAGRWGPEPPAFVFQTADACARSALRGFSRNRALVLPGFAIRAVITLGRWTPDALYRLVMAPFAWWLRRQP